MADLQAAIAACQQAMKLTPEGSPDRASWLNNLGSGLRDRYNRSEDLVDLQEAIAEVQQAVELTPED